MLEKHKISFNLTLKLTGFSLVFFASLLSRRNLLNPGG
jgi:predicted HTH domain antitoxin